MYHITPDIDNVAKRGLMSPRDLYENDRSAFKHVYNRYKQRAKAHSYEDVLNYLDNSPKRQPLSSRCIFWSFIPRKLMPYVPDTAGTEIDVPLKVIKKYALGSPILVEGSKLTPISWDDLKANYKAYTNAALQGAQLKPKGRLLYSRIPHIAVDSRVMSVG